MPKAYILVNVNSGSEDRVLKAAKGLDGVVEAFVCYGVYDLIFKVKANSMEELKELVNRRLRSIENVKSTLTLMLIEE